VSAFEIRNLKPSEYDAWDRLVEDSQQGTIFQKSCWLEASGVEFGIYGYFKGGQLFAGIPLVYRRLSPGIKSIFHPPLTPYLGIVFKEIKSKYVRRISNEKNISSIFAKRIKEDFDDIYIKFTPYVTDLQAFVWQGFLSDVRYTYILHIEDVESAWNNMSPERRNNVKCAVGKGICIENGGSFNEFFSLQQKSFERQGKNIDFESTVFQFNRFFTKCDRYNLFLARNRDGEAIAGVYLVWDNKRSYYILGGYDYEKSHHGAHVFALWEAIKFTREKLGLKQFDFEGSMIPAVEKFFRKFGGILTPYYTVTWQNRKAKFFMGSRKLFKTARKKFFTG